MKKVILFFALCAIITPFTLSQWIQMPAFPVSGTVYDMYFINQNTGWVTMADSNRILKTTNGGTSWVIENQPAANVYDIRFFDDTTGVVLGYLNLEKLIMKTTNGGTNWNIIYSSASNNMLGIYFVNRDTGWACGWDFSNAKIWRTTDGGNTFNLQYSPGPGSYFTKVLFLNQKVNNEYWGWALLGSAALYRTTNSGVNWTFIYNMESVSMCNFVQSFIDFYFKDTANGIATRGGNCIMLTTNGGFNWNFTYNGVNQPNKIGMANSQTGWITSYLDTVIKTTNFFQAYGKQYHPAFTPGEIFVIDTSYAFTAKAVFGRTTNGGGPFVTVSKISTNAPAEFNLSQNYPNPFNPQTTIEFSLPRQSRVTLIIYDILGREVYKEPESRNLTAGNYRITLDFDKLNISSGIYFYRLLTDNFTQTRKMVYIK